MKKSHGHRSMAMALSVDKGMPLSSLQDMTVRFQTAMSCKEAFR